MIKWITIALAVLGLAMGIWTVATSDEQLPDIPPAQPPSINPFPLGIAASGIVEAGSRNVEVAAPEPGLVTEVLVEVNDKITAGQPLFRLDSRLLEAELVRARAALAVAKQELEMWRSRPRPEDLPPLEAAVAQARAEAEDAADQLRRTEESFAKGAATAGEVQHLRFLAAAAGSALQRAETELARTKAGAWEQEIAVQAELVKQREAEIQALQIRIDRHTVRSPITGHVLKRLIEPGEYAAVGTGTAVALVVGDLDRLNVRAQVDEEDAPQLVPGARGRARLRGAIADEIPLTMIRIEPWAQPKTQITGSTLERVDTRVVEVLFRIDTPKRARVYPGQIVDVFIEAATGAESRPSR
jgi:HlyD family secretion protein